MNLLDQIFWKRFADEYRLKPDKPGPACFAGMLQVGVIVFMFFIAAFRLLARLLTLSLAAVGAQAAARVWHPVEFQVTMLFATIVTIYVVRRRYWDRRLDPEVSRRYGEELNRGVIGLFVLVLMGGAAVFMVVAFKAVKTYMSF